MMHNQLLLLLRLPLRLLMLMYLGLYYLSMPMYYPDSGLSRYSMRFLTILCSPTRVVASIALRVRVLAFSLCNGQTEDNIEFMVIGTNKKKTQGIAILSLDFTHFCRSAL